MSNIVGGSLGRFRKSIDRSTSPLIIHFEYIQRIETFSLWHKDLNASETPRHLDLKK